MSLSSILHYWAIPHQWNSKLWKKACTVLIHKKGDITEPAKFRPITLESVHLKIVSSCLRDSLFAFLKSNGFIEHKIQNGFPPKRCGTFEHIVQMANIINNARIKQRSVVITLLDLKNAFGDVHHNLYQNRKLSDTEVSEQILRTKTLSDK